MKLLLISDLHIGVNPYKYYEKRIDDLCKFIRLNIKDQLIIFVLGDIIYGGIPDNFTMARDVFKLLYENLRGYQYEIFFIPGNHDYCNNARNDFDAFLKDIQPSNPLQSGSAVGTYEKDDINFILCDSINEGNHLSPGALDMKLISANTKGGKQNILLMHHSLLFEDKSTHTGIVNLPDTLTELRNLKIQYVFHGHAHATRAYRLLGDITLIGAGPLTFDVSKDMENSDHQFNIVDTSGEYIEQIINYRFASDIYDYIPYQLYPPQPKYTDPKEVMREQYSCINGYFERTVLPCGLASGDMWDRLLNSNNETTLIEVTKLHKHVILVSDAGMGKSTELKQLAAFFFYNSKLTFPYLLQLSLYDGNAIECTFPQKYKTLDPASLILIMDGYDEIPDQHRNTFRQELKRYIKNNPNTIIIFSMRSTFMLESSDLFADFCPYKLLGLKEQAVRSYLERKKIDFTSFMKEVNAKRLPELLSVPFCLKAIAEIYLKEHSLPHEEKIIDSLISISIKEDIRKFEYKKPVSLENEEIKQKNVLKRIAFSMQLLNKNHIDKEEYQELFNLEERELAELSSLFSKDNELYSFSHNNFQEYLVAQLLNKLTLDEILDYITLTNKRTLDVKWINVLSYLVLLQSNNDLLGWLGENAPLVLTKFEASRVSHDTRFNILSQLLETIKRDNTWFDREFCSETEFATFCQSAKAIDLLLSEIIDPAHFRSQFVALSIILHITELFDKEKTIREILRNCYQSEKTRPYERMMALYALGVLGLDTSELTEEIITNFALSENASERLGVYRYLTETHKVDQYINVFLQGISILHRRSDDAYNGSMRYALYHAFESVSQPSTLVSVLNWLSVNEKIDIHDQETLLSHICQKAVSGYRDGAYEIYEAMKQFFIAEPDTYFGNIHPETLSFFAETGTLENLLISVVQSNSNSVCYIIKIILEKDVTLTEQLLLWYKNDLYECKTVFENFTNWINGQASYFGKFADAIYKKTGARIEQRPVLDYSAMRKASKQRFFDSLFSRENSDELLGDLLLAYGNENLTFAELKEIGYLPVEERVQGVQELKSRVLQCNSFMKGKRIKDFFQRIKWDSYVHDNLYEFLEQDELDVTISDNQMQYLRKWFEKLLKVVNLNTAIKDKNDNSTAFTIEWDAVYLIALWKHFKLDCPKSFYLGFLSCPTYYIMESARPEDKCKIIQEYVDVHEIKQSISENIIQGISHTMLGEYFCYCKFYSMQDAKELAITTCKSDSGSFILREAIDYLHCTCGSEVILSDVLPYANDNEELLTTIADYLYQENDSRLETALVKQFNKKKHPHLLMRLIQMNSKRGLSYYTEEVACRNATFAEGNAIDGVTDSICQINDPSLMPDLLKLIKLCFTPGFQDKGFKSLYSCLLEAIENCAKNDFSCVYTKMTELRESAKENLELIGFCSYVFKRLEQLEIEKSGRKYSLGEIKNILGKLGRI